MHSAIRRDQMKTVKAARIYNYDGAKALRFEGTPVPEPQSGEVLVRVHAAGVNPIDWKIRAGYLQQMKLLQLPFTLGGDFSGVVQAVGKDVAGCKVGDEVYGQASVFSHGSGSFAEFCLARAGAVALKPCSVSHFEACGLPTAGVSALQALMESLRLSAGQKILINGGASNIGSISIQLAKHLGAHVVTTASADDIPYVQGLGADEVIDYRSRKFKEVIIGFDAGVDTVGCDTYAQPFRVLKRGVRLSSILAYPGAGWTNDSWLEAFALSTRVTTRRLEKLAELVEEGALNVRVDQTFPLDQAGILLNHLETEPGARNAVLKMV
jgi:NADPH:quinone reductase-like Zn-dependent oxidoreductase